LYRRLDDIEAAFIAPASAFPGGGGGGGVHGSGGGGGAPNSVGAMMGEVVAACKLANAHDFIMALPEGYATEVHTSGSGGSIWCTDS
jgi:hypothetical protein